MQLSDAACCQITLTTYLVFCRTGISTMFSLVTALVSPCVIDLLAHKKEALVATLQENASVVCSHPADSVCLLQGEWDNVKKAYAIVEEFYLRAQASIDFLYVYGP